MARITAVGARITGGSRETFRGDLDQGDRRSRSFFPARVKPFERDDLYFKPFLSIRFFLRTYLFVNPSEVDVLGCESRSFVHGVGRRTSSPSPGPPGGSVNGH